MPLAWFISFVIGQSMPPIPVLPPPPLPEVQWARGLTLAELQAKVIGPGEWRLGADGGGNAYADYIMPTCKVVFFFDTALNGKSPTVGVVLPTTGGVGGGGLIDYTEAAACLAAIQRR